MTDTRDQTRTAGVDMREGGMPQGQAPARQPQMTAMQRAQSERTQRFNAFIEAATANQAIIERSLKHHGIAWDFFMAALEVGLRNTLKGDPAFFERVSPQSFLEATLKACHLGLLPDGKEGAVVRFAEDAAFLPMVEGFSKILWLTGAVVEINSGVVCEGDDFDFQEGDDGYVTHRRSLKRADNAEIIGAWCVIKLATGGKLIEVVDQVDLKKIAGVSRATKGPRVDWPREMARKAPFRRIVKRMPKTPGLTNLIAHDDTGYDLTKLAEPAAPSIPTNKLFSNRAVVRRKPMEVADARPDDANDGPPAPAADQELAGQGATPQGNGAGTADAGETAAHDQSALSAAIADIRHAADLTTLLEATQVALALAQDGDETEWVNEATAARKADLLPAEPFALTAVISSASGPKVYEDADLWRDDLLNKMAALKGDALMVFWKRNLAFIIEAGEAGFDEQATRLLDVAAEKRLPTEMPNG